ncbi:MAG: hypothetical protein JJ913_05135 [Rhizobiaceae bacterium]|nr:hypothetical protein [Rhizobiaceae bacterium]
MTLPAHAQMTSVYTELQIEKSCTVFARAEEGDGDWATLVCDGWRGYPVMLQYSDLRESLFYGYPPAGDMAPVWESFGGFNSTGTTIEWRLEQRGNDRVPIATIHRWFVSDAANGEEDVQVLVVEKVGQPHERDGCAMAYVVATGNSGANEKARAYADNLVHGFACGDQPAIDVGTVPLPEFVRYE